MNQVLGLCVIVSTVVGVIVNRKEIKEVWGALAERLPQPPIPQPVALVAIDGRVLREVMDITRP